MIKKPLYAPWVYTSFIFATTILFLNAGLIAEAAPPSGNLNPAIMTQPVFKGDGDSCELLLKSPWPLTQYSSFILSDPDRVVVDIRRADLRKDFPADQILCGDAMKVRIGRHSDKLRVVFDLVGKYEIQHRIAQDESGLKIVIEKRGEKKINQTKKKATIQTTESLDVKKDNSRVELEEKQEIEPIIQNSSPKVTIEGLLLQSQEMFASKQYVTVIDLSTHIITLDSRNSEAYSNRCGAYAMIDLYEKAYDDCMQAISISPDFPMAYNNLGWVIERQGNMEAALENYKKSCALKNRLGCRNYERLEDEIEEMASQVKAKEPKVEAGVMEEAEEKTELNMNSSVPVEDLQPIIKSGVQQPQTTKQLVDKEFPAEKISMTLYKSDITGFFAKVSTLTGLPIHVESDANAPLTLKLEETYLTDAIFSIITIYNLRIEKRENQFFIFSQEER
jgi:tetratricopeptide (TPR) repeat protein